MLSCVVHAAPAKVFSRAMNDIMMMYNDFLVSSQIQMIISITDEQDTLNSV